MHWLHIYIYIYMQESDDKIIWCWNVCYSMKIISDMFAPLTYSWVLYFVFIQTMEKLNLNYSFKNVPIPGNKSYQVRLIEKI